MTGKDRDPIAEGDAQWLALADQLPAIVWSVDRELRFTSSRGGGLSGLGLHAGQGLGRSLYEYFGTQDASFGPIAAHLRALAGEGVSYEAPWSGRWFETRTAPLCDETGAIVGALGMAIDVTERRRAEEARAQLQLKLRDQHRLEVIGQLGAGLAHEMNNPLQSILNFAQLMRSRVHTEELRRYAEEIGHEVQKLASVVRDLRRVAQPDDEEPASIGVHELLESALEMFRPTLRSESIALEVAVPTDLPAVWCRKGGVRQALVNLVGGSREALDRHAPDRDPPKQIRLSARLLQSRERTRVRISIADSGPPIPESSLAHAFEPFAQLGGRDHGSGLSLSISRAIARANGGELSVENNGDNGTCFHLDLPAAATP
ncbi:MAG: ATP-binding protein [Polyangiales bacterium]